MTTKKTGDAPRGGRIGKWVIILIMLLAACAVALGLYEFSGRP